MRPLAPRLRKLDLPLALGIALTVFVGTGVKTVRARDAGGKFGRYQIAWRQRMAAGAAQFRVALGKPVRHRNPFVEDEALALPQALFGRDLLEVFEDASLEVEHVLEAE